MLLSTQAPCPCPNCPEIVNVGGGSGDYNQGRFCVHTLKKQTKNCTEKVAKFPLPPNWPASRMEVSVDLKSLAMKLAVQCSLPGPGLAGAYRVIIWYIMCVQGDHIIQAVCRMCVQGDVNRTGWLPGRHLVAGQEAAGAELLGAYCGHAAAELQPGLHTPHSTPLPAVILIFSVTLTPAPDTWQLTEAAAVLG